MSWNRIKQIKNYCGGVRKMTIGEFVEFRCYLCGHSTGIHIFSIHDDSKYECLVENCKCTRDKKIIFI